MLLRDFLNECEKLDIKIDNAIGKLMSDERIIELGIDLDLNYVPHMRKAMAVRKLTTLNDFVKIDKAIKELRRNGEPVDFPQVAVKAGVTDPTVRKYFGEEIKRLRRLTPLPGAKTAKGLLTRNQRPASDESKDVMIAAFRKRDKVREEKLKEQVEANGVLLSEVVVLREEVSRLNRIIDKLEKGE